MNTQNLAYERIESYHGIRDTLGLTKNPERSHTWSLRVLDILRRVPLLGTLGMKQIREWCHFPDLAGEIEAGNFHLGELKMNYPVGTAAGMFKRADRVPWELFQEGGLPIGFVTIGCSFMDQPGNPKPRHYSFPNRGGIGGAGINRYGLNNSGVLATSDALAFARSEKRMPPGVLILANIFNGVYTLELNKAGELRRITQHIIDQVDAIEVNISCPNQAGGKGLQEKIGLLTESLRGVKEEAKGKPVFLKISPDTDESTIRLIIEASKDFVTGYSSTNTTTDSTIRRDILEKAGHGNLIGTEPDEKKQHGHFTLLNGGISGTPLLEKQLAMTKLIRELAPNHVIIGIGGVGDEKSAEDTIISGADAIGIYSRLALDGPGAVALADIGAARALKGREKKTN